MTSHSLVDVPWVSKPIETNRGHSGPPPGFRVEPAFPEAHGSCGSRVVAFLNQMNIPFRRKMEMEVGNPVGNPKLALP